MADIRYIENTANVSDVLFWLISVKQLVMFIYSMLMVGMKAEL